MAQTHYPKPAFLSDLTIHASVRRYFEALYNLINDFEVGYPVAHYTEEELLQLETHFEIKLPKAFRDFCLVANTNGRYYFGSYNLRSFKDVMNISGHVEKYIKGIPDDEDRLFKSSKPIPFGDDCVGNDIFLDFISNSEYQISIFGSEEESVINTPNFENFLDGISKQMEEGNIIVQDGYLDDDDIMIREIEWQISIEEMFKAESQSQ